MTTEITGDGTLVRGLGGESGFGEIELSPGGFSMVPVDISAVFEDGFFVDGRTISADRFWVSNNGFVSAEELSGFVGSSQLASARTVIAAAFGETMEVGPENSGIYVDVDTSADVVTFTWLNMVIAEDSTFRNVLALDEGPNSFQIQLFEREDGFDVALRYENIGFGGFNLSDPEFYPVFGVTAGSGVAQIPDIAETSAVLGLDTLPGNTGETGLWVFSVLEPEMIRSSGTDGNDTLNGGPGTDNLSGGAGNDIIVGFGGNDTLSGGADNDTIDGAVGNDLIMGGQGDDNLLGGRGNDTLESGPGTDTVFGGNGRDFIIMMGAENVAYGDRSNDTVRGGNGADTIFGGDGIDQLVGLRGDDSILGEAGGDFISGGTGNDTVDGGDGADDLNGGNGNDLVNGGAENDTIRGGSGSDTLEGGDGDDIVSGGAGNDILRGGAGDDRLSSFRGNGTLEGGAGNDTLSGEGGAMILIGGDGDDTYSNVDANDTIVEEDGGGIDRVISSRDFDLRGTSIEIAELTSFGPSTAIGNSDDNILIGNFATNFLIGGEGADQMIGGFGNDRYQVQDRGDVVVEMRGQGRDAVDAFISYKMGLGTEVLFLKGRGEINGVGNQDDNLIVGNIRDNHIIGREGNDVLDGQGGADTFVFDRDLGEGNVDRIRDFNLNTADEGDILKLKAAVFAGTTAGDLDDAAFHAGEAAQDEDDRFIFDQASGRLWFDADGNGMEAQSLVATFLGGAEVTAEDIVLF